MRVTTVSIVISGVRFSVSETEVVIQVPWAGVAWEEACLKNEGSTAFFFSLMRKQQESGYRHIQDLTDLLNMGGSGTHTGAKPIHLPHPLHRRGA